MTSASASAPHARMNACPSLESRLQVRQPLQVPATVKVPLLVTVVPAMVTFMVVLCAGSVSPLRNCELSSLSSRLQEGARHTWHSEG